MIAKELAIAIVNEHYVGGEDDKKIYINEYADQLETGDKSCLCSYLKSIHSKFYETAKLFKEEI